MSDITPMLNATRAALLLSLRAQAAGVHRYGKSDGSGVTVADYAAQAVLGQAIQRHDPGAALVAEESPVAYSALPSDVRLAVAALTAGALGTTVTPQDVAAWLGINAVERAPRTGRTYVIDPIDGTEGYVQGRLFAVCVGILEGGVLVGGLMGLPRFPATPGVAVAGGVVAVAAPGGDGAFLTSIGQDDPARVPLIISPVADPAQARLLESRSLPGWERDFADRVRAAAGFPAATPEDSALKYALLAAGHGEAVLRAPRDPATRPHMIWDHAAGAALIAAAGGRVSALDGAPLDWAFGPGLPSRGLVASNGALHDVLLGALAQVGEGQRWV